MADITSSLFPEASGLFQQQYLQAQQAGQAASDRAMGSAAQFATSAAANMAGFGGNLLGSSIGRALGGTTPEEDQAKAVKAIAAELVAEGKNPQTSEGMSIMVQRLNSKGLFQAAQKAQAAATTLREKEAAVGLQQAQTSKITEAVKQEAAYKTALAQLGPNPTSEQLTQLALQFSGPEKAAQLLQTSADRASTQEARKVAQEAQIAATKERQEERIQSQKERADADREFKQQQANLTAALRGSNNDTQRQLMTARLEDLQAKREEKQQAQLRQEQGALAGFDSALQTAALLKNHPGKSDVVGALTGGIAQAIPGTDAASFGAQLETFKAQTFLPQVAALKGMGALSDAEGAKLVAAVGALSTKMKQKEFDESLARVVTTLESAKQRIASTSKVLPAGQAQAAKSAVAQAPAAGQAYSDAEKERRYQEYKKARGM